MDALLNETSTHRWEVHVHVHVLFTFQRDLKDQTMKWLLFCMYRVHHLFFSFFS